MHQRFLRYEVVGLCEGAVEFGPYSSIFKLPYLKILRSIQSRYIYVIDPIKRPGVVILRLGSTMIARIPFVSFALGPARRFQGGERGGIRTSDLPGGSLRPLEARQFF